LFGQDFPDFGDVSPPRSESTSSDSYMTPSPDTMDDVELSEILSSTSASPGFAQSNEDFTIDLGRYFEETPLCCFLGEKSLAPHLSLSLPGCTPANKIWRLPESINPPSFFVLMKLGFI